MLDEFEKTFFTSGDFLQQAEARNLLQTVAAGSGSGTRRMSYTSMVSINGKTSSVHYDILKNGNTVQFLKQTSHNGKIIQAVYNYDAAEKKLETVAYKNRNIISKNLYTI